MKKLFSCFIIVFILVLSVFLYRSFTKTDIEKVLETKEYSYLPKEALNYIEKVYEETGEVVLTEKNKVENIPYMNPQYIEYLTLSKEEQKEVEEVPEIYKVDYVVKEKVDGASYPSKYDLRNVSGKNFITPIKDQESLDLCWAFTTTEQAESLLLKQSNTSYNSSSYVFSPRQLDYATSIDGITNYTNDIGIRPLAYGGNYFMALMAMSNGLGLTNESFIPFSLSMEEKSLPEVLNYAYSNYEVDSSIMVPSLSSSPTTTELDSFVNTVKGYIMEYGGVYAATQSPNRSCGAINTDGTVILRTDSNCYQNANHAMQIIGWDDNYSYSYCVSNKTHKAASTCSSGKVTGTGAWLVRNSWGDDDPYTYIYMAYDSIDYDVRLTTSLSKMSERNWDNNYHHNFDNYYMTTSSSASQYYQKKIDTPEKVEKVKFYVYGDGATFTLSITSNKEKYKKIQTATVERGGLYTFDLSDLDVIITDSAFSIEILGDGKAYFIKDSIAAFTSNVENDSIIQTEDIFDSSTGNDYQYTLYSNTKNIPSNSRVSYTLKNSNGTNYTSYLTVSNNVVSKNDINTDLVISKNIPSGMYTLTTTYGGKSFNSYITLGTGMNLSGDGTVSNPYILNSEEDLIKMHNALDAHYKLGKDITLTNEWIPVGTMEHPFTGSLDGNGHTIHNLKITKEYNYSGLFGYVLINDSSTTNFKNISLVNPEIDASGDAGALIGGMNGYATISGSSPTCVSTIQDITILNGHVYSYFSNAGALIGSIKPPINGHEGTHTYNINRVFNSSSVAGVLSTGMIGTIVGGSDSSSSPNVTLTNIQNMGTHDFLTVRLGNSVFFTGTHGTMVGYILNSATVTMENTFTGAYFTTYEYSGDGRVGYGSGYSTTLNDTKGYSNLSTSTTLSSLKQSSSYSSWSNFSSNWVLKTVDGISRYPVLKNVDFTYTTIPDITLVVGDQVNLSDYLTPKITAAIKLSSGTPTDSTVISATNVTDSRSKLTTDTIIKALKAGTSKIHITNQYDGYEKDITITVRSSNESVINFYKNDGSITSTKQNTTYGSTINLTTNSYSRVGYVFNGWNTLPDGLGENYSDGALVTVNFYTLNLYAKWNPITYSVQYLSNGGTGTMSNTNGTYDQPFTLRNNTFTRDGYTFVGWNTKADGTGTSYTNQQSVKNLTSVNNGVVKLYAQWQEEQQGTIEVTDYTVDDDKGFIDDISPKTTLSQYKKKFTLGTGYTMSIDLGDKNYIYSGSKVIFYYNGVKVGEYTNVVRGDINEDGIINSADLLKVVKHLKNTTTLTAYQKVAADCNFDNNINSADLLKIVKYLKGTGTIQR